MKKRSAFEAWLDRQEKRSARRMEKAISATHLRRVRDVFGQQAVPARGSVLASPVMASWDPEPDYFFHWLRDSALVMDAVITLGRHAASAAERRRWNGHFDDFVRFSLGLSAIDGADFTGRNGCRETTAPAYLQFLRSDNDLRRLRGEALLAEPRFNPDGTPDFLKWARPQYDGPALRALACLRYDTLCREQGRTPPRELALLLKQDLDFTARHADEECIGPWEEENEFDHHYYTALAQLGALHHGRRWAERNGTPEAPLYRQAEEKLRTALDSHWSAEHGVYTAIRGKQALRPGDIIDSCTILAPLDAALPDGRHSVTDPRTQATLATLETLFAREFPVNAALPAGCAPALGRSRGDRYFGGGAWYPATLGAATFYYRLAAAVIKGGACVPAVPENTVFRDNVPGRTPGEQARALLRRGDSFMKTVRLHTPADGSLSEQFDRATGVQTSARHLTWSYAAFIAAAYERKEAAAALRPRRCAARGFRNPAS